MLQLRRYRRTTLALLAAYLAATTLGDLFHDHDHGAAGCCPRAVACADHDHESGDVDHDHPTRQSADEHGSALHGDDGCAVCRLAGQRTVPAAAVEPLTAGNVIAEVAVAQPAQPIVSFARTTHSRAPPSLA